MAPSLHPCCQEVVQLQILVEASNIIYENNIYKELQGLRERFDNNYRLWNPELPYRERVRLTGENREIWERINFLEKLLQEQEVQGR